MAPVLSDLTGSDVTTSGDGISVSVTNKTNDNSTSLVLTISEDFMKDW